ncbi:hypothetical protein [Xenorhabdus anantnagensis]|uniref:Uncharacterized protein n=1 Tax=Xenorhabdus anantnagensis TaxID=3025875 RepID=A0ABT5LWS3_9GAMM|nr:hypothetical protein [Xenorhabdus anantnagensis]MDC9598905.1 hypothetical protein [Xenorhabdus anantnagensis]
MSKQTDKRTDLIASTDEAGRAVSLVAVKLTLKHLMISRRI